MLHGGRDLNFFSSIGKNSGGFAARFVGHDSPVPPTLRNWRSYTNFFFQEEIKFLVATLKIDDISTHYCLLIFRITDFSF